MERLSPTSTPVKEKTNAFALENASGSDELPSDDTSTSSVEPLSPDSDRYTDPSVPAPRTSAVVTVTS